MKIYEVCFYHLFIFNTLEFLNEIGIDYIVAIGGDGTFRGTELLEREGGPKCIGIPATIDNDIIGTDYAIGYDTARNTALQAIDKIRDTAISNSLYFLVETMGRNSGFLAADVGLAGGAELILVPEFPMNIEDIAKCIDKPKGGKQHSIIVVAEAGQSGKSFDIANKLKTLTKIVDYRVCILGHVQRGGNSTAQDRVAAAFMGNYAVEWLLEGKSMCMTSIIDGKYTFSNFAGSETPPKKLNGDMIIKLANLLSSY